MPQQNIISKEQWFGIMEEFVTDAINIKTYPLSENDNIVLMLTKNQGLIRGVAKGVKRPKSKLGARMQILVANKLMLRKGRNLSTISQAQAINTFNKLRSDLDRLTYSMYLAELISVFCEENSSSEDIYELFYSILEKISLSISKTEIL
jgi:DNA repair protein RecO (recombination protein O)